MYISCCLCQFNLCLVANGNRFSSGIWPSVLLPYLSRNEPLLILGLRPRLICEHVGLHLELVGEAESRVEQIEAVVDELLKDLELEHVLQEGLHGGRARLDERLGVKRDLLA